MQRYFGFHLILEANLKSKYRQTIATNQRNPMKVLRDFDYGSIKQENGRKIREFYITATNETIEFNSADSFNVWTYNARVPGPTLRAKVGDRVRIFFLTSEFIKIS